MNSDKELIDTLGKRHVALMQRVDTQFASQLGPSAVRRVRASYPFGKNNLLGGTPIDAESRQVEWTDNNNERRKIEFELKLSSTRRGICGG
jgi:hypothetical protein